MDNILQSLFRTGPRKDSLSDLLAVYLGGARVNPQGGIYRDFEEPLSTQYGTFMDPMTLGMMTPEVLQIMDELEKEKDLQKWLEYGSKNPHKYMNNLGTQIGN